MSDILQAVEPLIPALRRYARSLLRERAAADDLVQDTLELAITRWSQRREDGSVRSWLFAILHNLAVNGMRQRARRGAPAPLDEIEETASTRATQEDGLQHRDLMRALDRLPPEQKSVLVLVTVEDLSYAETAQVLGVPLGTVMSRLSRARAGLLALLEPDAPAAVSGRPHLRSIP